MIQVGIVDDHQLFLKSLSLMLHSFSGVQVLLEARNGLDLQEKMRSLTEKPDIMLIDVTMPHMDGAATTLWLKEQHPNIKLVALSMIEKDTTVLKMIRAGCCAYLLKDTHPDELEKALHQIHRQGYYNGDLSNIHSRRLLKQEAEELKLHISEREKQFLQFACTDKTYKEIAIEMNLSERTIDGYREALFQKLAVQSRVGLALEAIRRGLASL